MRTLLIELLCATTVTLGFAATVRGEVKDSIGILRSASAELVSIYEGYKKFGDTKPLKKATLQADAKVRNAIKQLFEKSGKLKSVMAQTEGVVRWCEWPADLSYSKNLKFKFGEGRFNKGLRINYRHIKAANGADLYVMQNSFWNKKGRGGRACPQMYAIVITGGKVTMSLPSTAMLGLEAPPSFLGFVDRGQFLPDLVILHGPHGSGSFSSYRLYSYDTKSGGWTNRLILRSSGTSEFSYDEKTSTLRYRTVIGGQWRKFILGDRTYVICGSSSPLRLKLSPIRGATYTKDKAPVSITFENTGDKAILIRHQRPYLSAFLYIELRQKDGTLVSQRPKEGLVSHNDKPRYVTVKRNKPYSFIVDVAKLRKVLMDGEYTLSVQYSSETETRGFVGLVRSNTMNIRIGN